MIASFNNCFSPKAFLLIRRYWLLGLPLLMLLPSLGSFPYPNSEAAFSDLSITHYPYGQFLKQSVWNDHHLPLWSPLIFSGSPFAANPLSGFYYPPGWLALLFPLPFGFNFLIGLHLLWGGIGAYKLLRLEGLNHLPGIFGSLALMMMPKLFAHYGAGHVTLLYAICWTPWLLWASRKIIVHRYSKVAQNICISLEGPILATIFLGDPRWSIYAGLFWIGYRLFVVMPNKTKHLSKGLIIEFFHIGLQTIIAALLAAPLAFPLMEFTRLSTRASLTASDNLIYSLPWMRILGLIIPDFGGFPEFMLYAGQVVFILGISFVCFGGWNREARYWFSAAWITLITATGQFFTPAHLLSELPIINLLRVPSRALFLCGMCFAFLASHGLERILAGTISIKGKRRYRLFLAGYLLFIFILSLGVSAIGNKLPLNFIWAAALALFTVSLLALFEAKRIDIQLLFLGVIVLGLLDWGIVDNSVFAPRSSEQVLAESEPMAGKLSQLAEESPPFRVYSPSYSLAQQTASKRELQLADGVDPLQLKAYSDFMENATGVPSKGYSVTIPPFAEGDPNKDNRNYTPDPELLGLLNVRYITAEFPLNVPGLVYEGQTGASWLYLNEFARPRAWIQSSTNLLDDRIREVIVKQPNPDQTIISAEGPGLVVLSEISYPGWRVLDR